MFKINQEIQNNTNKAIELYPYAQITRNKKPDDVMGFYILHEGFIGVFDEELKEDDYDDIEDNVERFNHIINQVEKLCNKGYDYIRDLYLESFDTILYNQKVLYDTKNNNFDKQFNKLIKDI